MKERTVAKTYAQAILELGNEQKVDVAKDLEAILGMVNSSNELENLLFLDVFTAKEKTSVLGELFQKANISGLVANYIEYLVEANRISLLPMITKEVIVYDDHVKGFLRGTIEGAEDSVDEAFKTQITNYLKNKLGKEPTLNYQKNENISAGYRVTVEDLQLDASIDNQLDKFKQTVLGNF